MSFCGDDGHGGIATKTINLAPNNVPTLEDQSSSTNDSSGVVNGTLEVDDLDNDALTYTTGTQPTKGTVVVRQDGTWTYTPHASDRHAAGALGASESDRTDNFTITVSDGQGGSIDVPVKVNLAPALDPNAATVTQVTPGGVYTGYAVSPDGEYVYALDGVDRNPGTTGKLHVIRADDNAIVQTIDVGSAPSNVVVSKDGKRIYVANSAGGDITVIERTGDSHQYLDTINLGSTSDPGAMALSQDGKTLYVSHYRGFGEAGRISLFDTDLIGTGTDPYIRSIETGDHRIMALASNSDGTKLYGAGTLYSDPQHYDKLTVINTATDDVSQPIDLVATGIGASPDGDTIYVGTARRRSRRGGYGNRLHRKHRARGRLRVLAHDQ